MAVIHHPDYPPTYMGTYTLYSWRCSCGEWTMQRWQSKTAALLDYESSHRYAHIVDKAPQHVVTFEPGGFGGGPTWTCDCGAAGEPAGYRDERRARQSHSNHRNTALKNWWTKFHAAQLRKEERGLSPAELADLRKRREWWAKDPETRARQAAYVLETQIL